MKAARALALALLLGAGPALAPRPAGAAPAALTGEASPAVEARAARTAAQYEAAYCYALACLAGLHQDLRDQAALLDRALKADPGSALLAQERARTLALLDDANGDDAAAVLALQPLVRRGLADLDDRELLGLCLEKLGRRAEALAQYRAITAADPTRDAVWGHIADCDGAAGDQAAERADLEAGFKASPDSPLLADRLGRFLYGAQDYAGAAAAFDRLAALDPGDARVLLYRGLARLKSGRYREAADDLDKAGSPGGTELDQSGVPSDDRGLLLLLAEAREEAGDLDGAARALRRALAKSPDPDLRFELATVLDKAGRWGEAEAELRKTLAESPRDAEALNYLGYSWVDRGERLPEAEGLIRRALAVDPGNPYYLDSLGWDLHLQGKDRPALDALRGAAKPLASSSNPDEAVVFDHLARVERDLGHAREAGEAGARAKAIRARAARGSKERAAGAGRGSKEE